MSAEPLGGIRACVFDAYGTLFDFASAAASCADVLGDRAARLTALWRDKQLQYAWLRSIQGRHADFWQVTGDALDFAMEALGLADKALHERLMNLYLTLAPFPDAVETVRRLRASGMKMAILSQGSPAMLGPVVEAAGLTQMFDAVLSVEEVGVFKPHPSTYQLAVDRLGRLRRGGFWDARHLVQPLPAAARTPSRLPRTRNPLTGGIAGTARSLSRAISAIAYCADLSQEPG
jgi:2-haloacid dehalogenase